MSKYAFLIIGLIVVLTNDAIGQVQKLVTIEMYRYNRKTPSNSGFGISTYTSAPFIVKTTDALGEVTEKIYETENWRNPIETLPYLRKEIDLWLSNGYKLFSFNITATGEANTNYAYLVLLVKEE